MTTPNDNTPTPRTDAAEFAQWHGSPYMVVDAHFARQLERELAEVKKNRDEWWRSCEEVAASNNQAIAERDAARAERDELFETIKGWKQAVHLRRDECEKAQHALEKCRLEIERLTLVIGRLLDHCPDSECMTCGEIVCQHGDPLHYHHDGCPSCHSPTPSSQPSPPTATASPAPETATASRLAEHESRLELLLRRTEFLLEQLSQALLDNGEFRIAWPADLAVIESTSTSQPTGKPSPSGDANCG